MNSDLNTLRPGGDPRTLSDFSALKEELNKRFHPARPDVDWARAHGLCLSLFNQNGADLQTAAWFTLIRQHQAGIDGLNEGLSIIQILLSQHWQAIWPQQTHARVEILSVLSQQLIAGLRSIHPIYADLPALYQAESTLSKIGQQLQSLELKHLTQLERLQDLLTTQARQLESTDMPDSGFVPSTPLKMPPSSPSSFHVRTAATPISIKANATLTTNSPQPTAADIAKKQYRRGLGIGILAGLVTASVLGTGILYGLSPDFIAQIKASKSIEHVLPKLPDFNVNTESILKSQLVDKANPEQVSTQHLASIDGYLGELESLSPIWSQEYAFDMVSFLKKQFNNNSDINKLNEQWQQNIQVNALPEDRLNQWSEGMAKLNALSLRLDSLDGKPRSYMTGSELKTIIFNARENFNRSIPLEEELRQLEALQKKGTVAESEYQRIDTHFKQLLNRYTLILHEKSAIE
ncbi:MAG: VasL domain-containing protein [Providencia heimbachae]|uniref:VasL domain-containing protein n=1 Tax=Providencia heimbachae TaxID=333962 RepID=UPI0010BF29F3|nr:VasL domain-containing protein [Providencia heimbachae]MDD9339944.1 VasL domain-containing protein [Providencia heimbachae]QCJ70130.1 hypothetical protein C9446_09870 [Providencia heimbachae]